MIITSIAGTLIKRLNHPRNGHTPQKDSYTLAGGTQAFGHLCLKRSFELNRSAEEV
jgi:hypothetical protein